jgi:hypothetical protein
MWGFLAPHFFLEELAISKTDKTAILILDVVHILNVCHIEAYRYHLTKRCSVAEFVVHFSTRRN